MSSLASYAKTFLLILPHYHVPIPSVNTVWIPGFWRRKTAPFVVRSLWEDQSGLLFLITPLPKWWSLWMRRPRQDGKQSAGKGKSWKEVIWYKMQWSSLMAKWARAKPLTYDLGVRSVQPTLLWGRKVMPSSSREEKITACPKKRLLRVHLTSKLRPKKEKRSCIPYAIEFIRIRMSILLKCCRE